jgi:hypothetical protein
MAVELPVFSKTYMSDLQIHRFNGTEHFAIETAKCLTVGFGMRQAILLITVLAFAPSAALATSGWDRHDVKVGNYRIHGKNGGSYVHRIAADGTLSQPPLCSNLNGNHRHFGLGCPPDYAVTNTHIAVRYPIHGSRNAEPNHFLIRIADDHVTGPLSLPDFLILPDVDVAALEWETPATPSEWPLTLIFLLLYILHSPLILGTLVIGTICVVVAWMKRRQIRRQLGPAFPRDSNSKA